MASLFLSEHRCSCGKLLLKGIFFNGTLEIKCKRCKEINKIGSLKLADDAAHYLLIINEKCVVTNCSDSACRILGYVHDELIGKYFTQINPTMPKEIGKKFFGSESILREDNFFRLDTSHQTKDGKKIPVAVFLKIYQPAGKEKYVLLSAELKNTVSDRKTLKKDALEFLDKACDFNFDLDRDEIILYTSPSVEKLFGYTPEDCIGKNYFDFTPAKKRKELRKTVAHFSDLHQPFRIENKDGIDKKCKVVHNELYFTPRFDGSGKFIGYRVLGWVKKSQKNDSKKTIYYN